MPNSTGCLNIYCVKDYGVVGDGVKDDTAAIQSVIDDVIPARGGILFFPPGTYKISGTAPDPMIRITKPVNMIGSGAGYGRNATIIRATTPTYGDVINVQSLSVYISDIFFDSEPGRTAGPDSTGAYINFTGLTQYCMIERFIIHKPYIGIQMSAPFITAQNGALFRIGAGVSGGGRNSTGILIAHDRDTRPQLPLADHHIFNVSTYSEPGDDQPTAGVWVKDTGNLRITNCDFVACGNCLHITGGESIHVMNTFFDSATNGIVLNSSDRNIARCHFIGCWTSTHSQFGVLFGTTGHYTIDSIKFIGHIAILNGLDGLNIGTGPNRSARVSNVQINDGSFSSNQGSGISISGDLANPVTNVSMVGNRCGIIDYTGIPAGQTIGRNGNKYGIYIVGTQNLLVTNNNLMDNMGMNASNPILINHFGTTCILNNNLGTNLNINHPQ